MVDLEIFPALSLAVVCVLGNASFRKTASCDFDIDNDSTFDVVEHVSHGMGAVLDNT